MKATHKLIEDEIEDKDAETSDPDEVLARAHELDAKSSLLKARAIRLRKTVSVGATTWLPLNVAGDIASVKPRVITDAARRGEITLTHAGRSPRVMRSELDRWIASRATTKPIASTPDANEDELAFARARRRAGGGR
jgi:hypothetical protein